MRFGLFFPAATAVVWRLRVMMLKLSPVRLAGKGYRPVRLAMRFLLAGIFMLGALSANAAEPIIVPIHTVKVVKLDRDASVVLIANPVIANVAVESKRLIFVFGLEPGETNLVVLDSDGEEILTAPVVVVPILERRVTISRVNVNEEATFSCAPRCVIVATPAGTGASAVRTGSGASGERKNPAGSLVGEIGPGRKQASKADEAGADASGGGGAAAVAAPAASASGG
jgi:hypothetical protein